MKNFFVFCSHSLLAGGQSEITKKISDFIRPYVESKNFGGSILVVKEQEILFEDHFGMADYELEVPVDSETKFNIASVSKSFTAASILLLQEKGRLEVRDPVSRFLPDYPNGDVITIHDLLVHTSGIPRLIFFPEYQKLSKQFHTTAEVVDLFKDKSLEFRPGERSAYSNSNYILLAFLVEKISGRAFAEFLQTHIFEPLEMSNTVLDTGNNDLIMNRSAGYEVVGFYEFENTEYANSSILVGASSIYTTATDLYKWISGLLAGKVLNSESLAQMFMPHAGQRGYGWMVDEQFGRKVFSMGGWSNHGYISGLTHFPDEKITIVILSNIEIITIKEEIESNIVAILLDKDYTPFQYNPKPMDPSLAKKVAGTYRFGKDFYNPGGTMKIVIKDGYLYEYQETSSRYVGMIQIGDLTFIHRSSWGRVVFEEGKDGEIISLKIYGAYTAQKIK
jgi:CubicO group peptidase (beta-lactamase class C family)